MSSVAVVLPRGSIEGHAGRVVSHPAAGLTFESQSSSREVGVEQVMTG